MHIRRVWRFRRALVEQFVVQTARFDKDIDVYQWDCLADAVRARRVALNLTQADVAAAGGPSAAKIREIENLRATTISTSKRRDLERALQWPIGTVDAALDGSPPEAPGADADARGDQSAGIDAHLRAATGIQGSIKALHAELPTASGARLHILDALVAVERAIRELNSAGSQSDQGNRPA